MRDENLKSPETWRERVGIELGDVIGKVLQLDDKRGMMFGYTGFGGVQYSGICLGG